MDTDPGALRGSSRHRLRTELMTRTRTQSVKNCIEAEMRQYERQRHTLRRAVEADVELLHAIVHQVDFIVRHQPERRDIKQHENIRSTW